MGNSDTETSTSSSSSSSNESSSSREAGRNKKGKRGPPTKKGSRGGRKANVKPTMEPRVTPRLTRSMAGRKEDVVETVVVVEKSKNTESRKSKIVAEQPKSKASKVAKKEQSGSKDAEKVKEAPQSSDSEAASNPKVRDESDSIVAAQTQEKSNTMDKDQAAAKESVVTIKEVCSAVNPTIIDETNQSKRSGSEEKDAEKQADAIRAELKGPEMSTGISDVKEVVLTKGSCSVELALSLLDVPLPEECHKQPEHTEKTNETSKIDVEEVQKSSEGEGSSEKAFIASLPVDSESVKHFTVEETNKFDEKKHMNDSNLGERSTDQCVAVREALDIPLPNVPQDKVETPVIEKQSECDDALQVENESSKRESEVCENEPQVKIVEKESSKTASAECEKDPQVNILEKESTKLASPNCEEIPHSEVLKPDEKTSEVETVEKTPNVPMPAETQDKSKSTESEEKRSSAATDEVSNENGHSVKEVALRKRRHASRSRSFSRPRRSRTRSRERRHRRSRSRSRTPSRDRKRKRSESMSLERRREERKRRHAQQEKREEEERAKRSRPEQSGRSSRDPTPNRNDKNEAAAAAADKDNDNATVTDPKAKITERQRRTVDLLTSRTGGAYIPPAKLRMMQAEITDKSSAAYQRIAWEALKKSIHGYINKVNVDNIAIITRELLKENIVRGRGLLCRSIIQAQAASPTFTHVYAALVSIINSKFPNIGELLLKRLVIQFRRAFRRNDKVVCLSASRFIGHLVNQRVTHEILALEILTLLVETPTDDSVEVAIAFLKECGMKLTEVTSKGIGAIFEMLKNILHEGKLDKRVQYMIEVVFQVRKDGFKDHQSVIESLELVEEDDQITHLLMLDDATDPDDGLNVFKFDDKYASNEEKYKGLTMEILGSDASNSNGSDSDSESGSDDSSNTEGEAEKPTAGDIIDNTETNMIALRRTIYLTINSSLDYEECAHKLMKMQLKPGQEVELCHMFLDCCAEQRTYEKFYGLLAQRFCSINKIYIEPFEDIFRDTYQTTHRLDTNRLRNVSKFFAHLLFTDAISWDALDCLKLNEEDTTSSSRIFIKILFQELAEYMGLGKLNTKLKDEVLTESLSGLFPKDNPRNTRFAINFFTSIGLGGLTDELRHFLKNAPKSVPAINAEILANQPIKLDSSSSASSSESSSSSSSSTSSSSSSNSEAAKKKKKKRKQSSIKPPSNKKTDKSKNRTESKKRQKKKRGRGEESSSCSGSSDSESSSSSSSSEDEKRKKRKKKTNVGRKEKDAKESRRTQNNDGDDSVRMEPTHHKQRDRENIRDNLKSAETSRHLDARDDRREKNEGRRDERRYQEDRGHGSDIRSNRGIDRQRNSHREREPSVDNNRETSRKNKRHRSKDRKEQLDRENYRKKDHHRQKDRIQEIDSDTDRKKDKRREIDRNDDPERESDRKKNKHRETNRNEEPDLESDRKKDTSHADDDRKRNKHREADRSIEAVREIRHRNKDKRREEVRYRESDRENCSRNDRH